MSSVDNFSTLLYSDHIERPTGAFMVSIFLDYLFPLHCCGDCGRWDTALCEQCLAPNIKPIQTRLFDIHVYGLGRYQNFILQQAVTGLKYDGIFSLAQILGQHLKMIIPTDSYDYIVPVPLHTSRLRERGFNQSQLLAMAVSVEKFLQPIERIVRTPPQASLNRERRLQNLRGIFSLLPKYQSLIHQARILLIDDVCTTGSTLAACSQILYTHGAAKVDAAVIAID